MQLAGREGTALHYSMGGVTKAMGGGQRVSKLQDRGRFRRHTIGRQSRVLTWWNAAGRFDIDPRVTSLPAAHAGARAPQAGMLARAKADDKFCVFRNHPLVSTTRIGDSAGWERMLPQ